MLFGPQKWSCHKVEKNRHFAKGLVHGVRQKIDLFLICFFFFTKKGRKKNFLIFWIQKNAFWPEKWSSKKVEKIDILQTGYSMVFLKELPFSSSVLLSKESQKETFFDLLNSEKCFLDLKSEKIDILPRG